MSEQFVSTDIGGTKHYFKDKELTILHRIDGPAIEHSNGDNRWYLNDVLLTEDQINNLIRESRKTNVRTIR